jgi:Predicted acyl-CoA transferases/carnitine dehydratase
MYGVIGILLALITREKTGRGQFIDVSLYDTSISFMNYWITYYSLTGKNPPRLGSAHEFAAPYQVFETKDNFIFIGVSTEKMWREFCRFLNLGHLYDDPRFTKNVDRSKNRDKLIPLIQETLKKYTTVGLMKMMDLAGIPCARVLTIDQVLEDPHTKARNSVIELNDPEFGKVKVPNITIRMSDTPGQVRRLNPRIGEHSVEILREAGFNEKEIATFMEKKVISQYRQ